MCSNSAHHRSSAVADLSNCTVTRSRSAVACLALLCVTLCQTAVTYAQNADSAHTARAADVLARVRRYTSGDVQAARALADSLVSALPADATVMPEALFAKASIAASAADAAREYSRIVTDYRFAARVPDALMRLAILESARNNRLGALGHLDRLLRDHGESAVRSRASLLAGRMRMDMNDPARGCDLLAAAFASAGANERDVIDQAQTAAARCPTSIAVMAERDPPPMGITRAPRAVPGAGATLASVSPRRGPARASPAAVPLPPAKVSAPVARRDDAVAVTPVTHVTLVVRRDTVRAAAPITVAAVPATEATLAAPSAAPIVAATGARTAAPSAASIVAATAARTAVPYATPTNAAIVGPSAASTVVSTVVPTVVPSARPAAAERYGVQFAAYNDRPGAARLAAVLQERGISARVEGTTAPFRVRAGRFTTRAEAEAAATLWRRSGQAVMIVPLGPTP